MYSDIVIATDGSDEARRAADHGVELAANLDATVHALSVAKNFEARDQIRANPEERASQAITYVEHAANDRDVDVQTAVRGGDPCETILAYTDEVDAEAIVVGSTTPSGMDRMLHGSVANCVSMNAAVPVLVINEQTGTQLAIPDDAAYTFRCPQCEGTVLASESTREGILERGCIMCGADVSEDTFESGVGEVTGQ